MTTDAREIARNLLNRRSGGEAQPASATIAAPPRIGRPGLVDHPAVVAAVQQSRMLERGLAEHDVPNPFFVSHLGVNGAVLDIFGGKYVNWSGYNYLGLAGDDRVRGAAAAAIDRYGTSCSASRVASGQIPLHRELEERIAGAYGVEDAVVTGSGYLTNAAVIGFVLGPGDLAVCDALVHNSIVSGTKWAGCQRSSFRHNDAGALEELLKRSRHHFSKALVIVEGVYSMDGDIVALPELVEVARRYDCWVMVDEAHSFGVLGSSGFGVGQHFRELGVPAAAVEADIWMGTLSKSLASYGGFVAGSAAFCEAMRTVAPGINMFAAAPPPSSMGAAVAAFDTMVAEPERLVSLRSNSASLAASLVANGVDIGLSGHTPVVPALTRASQYTLMASQALLEANVNANPVLYPAVAEGEARIRFFVTAEHTQDQIEHTATVLSAFLAG